MMLTNEVDLSKIDCPIGTTIELCDGRSTVTDKKFDNLRTAILDWHIKITFIWNPEARRKIIIDELNIEKKFVRVQIVPC